MNSDTWRAAILADALARVLPAVNDASLYALGVKALHDCGWLAANVPTEPVTLRRTEYNEV